MMCSGLWLTLVAAVLPHRFSKKCSRTVDRYLCTTPEAQIATPKLFYQITFARTLGKIMLQAACMLGFRFFYECGMHILGSSPFQFHFRIIFVPTESKKGSLSSSHTKLRSSFLRVHRQGISQALHCLHECNRNSCISI